MDFAYRVVRAACLLLLVAGLCGCGWWSSFSEKTSSLTDPRLDYADYAPHGDRWRLARLFAPVDERIHAVTKELVAIETFPGADWYESFMERNPWLASVAAVDSQGRLLGRLPDVALMPLDPQEFMSHQEDWERATFRSFFRQTALGPEICFVQPMFLRNNWVGLIIVQFDPRSLRQYSPEPERLAVLHPGLPLWPATDANGAGALVRMDWDGILRKRVGGTLKLENETYTWLARHIGDTYMIYAVLNRAGE